MTSANAQLRAGPTTPLIYCGRGAEDRVSPAGRLLAFFVGVGCLAVLVLAAWLQPSPSGVGSHTRMGLDRCQFLQRTGLPCLTCGYTTSFTWFARGNLAASFYVQPAGMVTALAAALTVWVAFYIAVTGRPVHRLLASGVSRRHLIYFLGFALCAWGWKIFIHLNGMDGWR